MPSIPSPAPAKKIPLRDIPIAATVLSETGELPTLQSDRNLIIFEFEPSEAVTSAISKYLSNGSVPVQDFFAAYKRLRTMMYAAKG